jgi:CRISPR/Cas system CSM-associated protein Csm3 (group 7 of RAMP superfamily)
MSGRTGRDVIERIFIEGVLTLETPAGFGNGDAAGPTDMPLLRDPQNGRPLLTGASIAGALRSYLREYEAGYGARKAPLADALFGRIDGKTSYQSRLMVDDALGDSRGVELRDGVALDLRTRTAEDKKKYDMELLQAGTTFPLQFELLLTENDSESLPALAAALRGLEQGEIGLGVRKRRGLGRCRAGGWTVRRYRMDDRRPLIAWLEEEWRPERPVAEGQSDIVALLGVDAQLLPQDRRMRFSIDAAFALPGSLLIRSGAGGAQAPDMVHLRNGEGQPILSGTSLAGAVRARALRIANTVLGAKQGAELVDGMFGRRIETSDDEPTGSRVTVQERALLGSRDLVQNRVKIDRFTGGAYPTALFSEQPAFGAGDAPAVEVKLELRFPHDLPVRERDAQIGLLLLVLKDLWTGDLPLGGESSVGRGRLAGKRATLTLHGGSRPETWELAQDDNGLAGATDQLERYVKALNAWQPARQGDGRDT